MPEKVNVRSSHCGSWTESGVSAPHVLVKPYVGSAESSRPTSPMKSSMAASADEDMVGHFAFITRTEDQLPLSREIMSGLTRRETVSAYKEARQEMLSGYVAFPL